MSNLNIKQTEQLYFECQPLEDSLEKLARDVDKFILEPRRAVLDAALNTTSQAFYQLWRAYCPKKETFVHDTYSFLDNTSRLQNQINAVCNARLHIRTKEIRYIKERYGEEIGVRRDIITRMQEGASLDELKKIMQATRLKSFEQIIAT